MIKTIEITPPGDIPAEKQERYIALKLCYTQLTEKPIRTDEDREEMAKLIKEAQKLYSTRSE